VLLLLAGEAVQFQGEEYRVAGQMSQMALRAPFLPR
jgi:hypothetical protein